MRETRAIDIRAQSRVEMVASHVANKFRRDTIPKVKEWIQHIEEEAQFEHFVTLVEELDEQVGYW